MVNTPIPREILHGKADRVLAFLFDVLRFRGNRLGAGTS